MSKQLPLAHQYALGLRQSVEEGEIADVRLEMRNILGAPFLAWNAGDRWLYPEFTTEVFKGVPYLTDDMAYEFINFCRQIGFLDSRVERFKAQRLKFENEALNSLQRDVAL